MPIDYLDPRRSGDLEYQRGLRTAALDRELQYDMPSYGGNVAKIQARGLQYGRDRQRLNSQLDAGGFDPLYSLNAQSAQIQRDTPTEFDQPGGGGSATAQPFRGGWNFGPRAARQPSYDALDFSDRLAANARSLSRRGYSAPSASIPDYLAPRPVASRRPAWQDAPDDGPTDADRAAMQERTYQGQLDRGEPVALARKQQVDSDKRQAEFLRAQYLAAPSRGL